MSDDEHIATELDLAHVAGYFAQEIHELAEAVGGLKFVLYIQREKDCKTSRTFLSTLNREELIDFLNDSLQRIDDGKFKEFGGEPAEPIPLHPDKDDDARKH